MTAPDPWEPPARPRPGTRWWTVVLPLVLVAGLCLAVVGIFYGFVTTMSANHAELDRIRRFDDPGVRETASAACARLATEVGARPSGPEPTAARVQAVREGNAAIARLVARMRALGPEALAADPPALDWIADWERLAARRETFATDLEAGRPATFTVPADDGVPITERMESAAGCLVPERLVTP